MTEGVVLAVASAKGGVGKTTTSINLGAAVATRTAKSTLLIEADLAMANVLDFLDLQYDPQTDPSLHEVLADEAVLSDAIFEADCGLHILPSGDDIDGFQKARPENLRSVIEESRDLYEVVIVDTPAGVSLTTILPIGLSDGVLLVSTPRVSAVRDTQKTKSIVERLDGNAIGLLLTMTGTGTAPPPDRLANFMEIPLIGDVPNDPMVSRAQDAGRPVIEYAPDAPASRGYLEAAGRMGMIPSPTEASTSDTLRQK